MEDKSPVLVTGARAPVALHMARLLHQAGYPVVLADQFKRPIAATSRCITTYHQIPPFTSQASDVRAALTRIIATNGVSHVVPTCEEVLHLAAIWAREQMDATLVAPDIQTLVQAHNKYSFIQLCAAIGLAVPETRLLKSSEDVVTYAATSSDYVFKPVWSRFGTRVMIRPDAQHLRQIKPTTRSPWVAQTCLSGREICAYAVARGGRITALSAYEGLVKAGPGAAVCFVPVDAEIIRPFAGRFIAETGWNGQIAFDVMQMPDGTILPLECNPRATSGLHFFTNGPAFADSLLTDTGTTQPDVAHPQAVRLALWLYGLPQLLQRQRRASAKAAFMHAGDVMNWPGDKVGLFPQLRSVSEVAGIALRHRISLEQATTQGIEWNGAEADGR